MATALEQFPPHALLAARCAQVIEQRRSELPDSLLARIDAFLDQLKELCARQAQLDALGDLQTPPEALFELLGEASTQIEPHAFDAVSLHNARLGLQSRAHSASALLEKLGLETFSQQLRETLQAAVADLKDRAEQFPAFGLFVNGEGFGFVLGLRLYAERSGEVRPFADAGSEMAHQGRIALDGVFPAGARWDIEWPLQYEGSSIGLGLRVAGLMVRNGLTRDPLLAATGTLDVGGSVHGVESIPEKLRAAATAGIRRVLLPEENRAEAEAANSDLNLELLFLSTVNEIPSRLAQVSTHADLSFEGRVRMVRTLLPLYGLALLGEKKLQNAHRFEASDAQERVAIDVYTGRAGTVRAHAAEGTAKRAAESLIHEHIDRFRPQPRPPLSFMIPTEHRQRRLVDAFLGAGGRILDESQHVRQRLQLVRGSSVATVTTFTTSRATLSGSAPAFDEARALIAETLQGLAGVDELRAGIVDAPLPEDAPHIGTDESGKGDYFGPLVSAAVFADAETAEHLKEIGVKDSKQLSDTTVRKLAGQISPLTRGKVAVTPVNPRRFNGLYQKMRGEGKNLNTLLAWGHARSIEDLLGKRVDPKFAIIDQFADARYIEEKILRDTRRRELRLVQRPKAESDIAVAAASILARAAFLDWMEKTSRELGIDLPKGASDRVVETAREIVRRFGAEKLRDVAKLPFKTTERVLDRQIQNDSKQDARDRDVTRDTGPAGEEHSEH